MKRALPAFGLALLAALALSGLTAPLASAEFFIFTSEAEKTTLAGEQVGVNVLKTDAGSLECESATFKGEMSQEGAVELVLTPEYKGCKFVGMTAEVVPHSCHLVFRVVARESGVNRADAVVDCEEAGDKITIVSKLSGVTKCTVDIGEQEGLSQVNFTNEGTPQKARATISLSGIQYDQTPGTGLGACSKAEKTGTGTYQGIAAIKSLAGETQVNLNLEPIPQTIKIDNNPVVIGGKVGDKATFEVESVAGEAVTVVSMLHQANIGRPKIGCGKLAKKGDKCQEEIECVGLRGKVQKIALITAPPGGDMVGVKTC